jgi:hypothetical protein
MIDKEKKEIDVCLKIPKTNGKVSWSDAVSPWIYRLPARNQCNQLWKPKCEHLWMTLSVNSPLSYCIYAWFMHLHITNYSLFYCYCVLYRFAPMGSITRVPKAYSSYIETGKCAKCQVSVTRLWRVESHAWLCHHHPSIILTKDFRKKIQGLSIVLYWINQVIGRNPVAQRTNSVGDKDSAYYVTQLLRLTEQCSTFYPRYTRLAWMTNHDERLPLAVGFLNLGDMYTTQVHTIY